MEFVGIAGPKMIAEGAHSLFPIEKLSVHGFGLDVLRAIPEILTIRNRLKHYFIENPPDVFIGIDAPDFNFSLEKKIKSKGIPTVHYVSPSIWAWRGSRIGKIRRAVSHMLVLFPFEQPLYKKFGIPVTFVGHPLADQFPISSDKLSARKSLKLKNDQVVVAMLPGSRLSEVRNLAQTLVATARILSKAKDNITFLVPLITRETKEIFESHIYSEQKDIDGSEDLPIQILFGHSHLAMKAADVVIVASGTATLEAALIKRPMVITYKLPWLNWQILRRMSYLPYFGLPNILAGRFIVPELLQNQATPENLAKTTLNIINDAERVNEMMTEFNSIHLSLQQNTDDIAAQAILGFLK